MSDERDLLTNRRAKMEQWLELEGSYVNDFRREHLARQLHDTYADADKPALENMQADHGGGPGDAAQVGGQGKFITFMMCPDRFNATCPKVILAMMPMSSSVIFWTLVISSVCAA